MKKGQKAKIFLICLGFLGLAWMMERAGTENIADNRLMRREAGQGDTELTLCLDAEGILKDYNYSLAVTEYQPTREEAGSYFQKAREEIDHSFYGKGEKENGVTRGVNLAESYVQGAVTADWTFDRLDVIDPEGVVIQEAVPKEGAVVWGIAELTCGTYQEVYQFPFRVVRGEESREEALLRTIKEEISAQQCVEGQKYIELPREAEGAALVWKPWKERLVWKVFLMEGVILLLIPAVGRERRKAAEKERRQQMLLDYPDIVSQLTVLVSAGLSVRQSWNRISARYINKKRKDASFVRWGYEELSKTCREMEDGKGERLAYESFGERVGLRPYHRFIRILAENLQKGNRRLASCLEQETEAAFEERALLAKKLGEEASTKMLLPLILMMAVVMAIVIMPAIIGFI